MWKWVEESPVSREEKIAQILELSEQFSDDLIFINTTSKCGRGRQLLSLLSCIGIKSQEIFYHAPMAPDHENKSVRIIHV